MFLHPLPGSQVALFVDLTSATDLLPLDLCKAIWLGVVEGLGLPDWMTRGQSSWPWATDGDVARW